MTTEDRTLLEERRKRFLGPLDVGSYTPGIERVEKMIEKSLLEHDELCKKADNPEWYKDYSLLNHCNQVAQVMEKIGKARHRTEIKIITGRIAGLSHDVGKIEETILRLYRLNRRLTDEEKVEMDKHSAFSGDYLLDRMVNVRSSDRVLLSEIHLIVRYHHNPEKVGDPSLREMCFDLNRADIFVSLMETRHRVGLDQFTAADALEEITLKDIKEARFKNHELELQASVQTIVRLFGAPKSEMMNPW